MKGQKPHTRRWRRPPEQKAGCCFRLKRQPHGSFQVGNRPLALQQLLKRFRPHPSTPCFQLASSTFETPHSFKLVLARLRAANSATIASRAKALTAKSAPTTAPKAPFIEPRSCHSASPDLVALYLHFQLTSLAELYTLRLLHQRRKI
jgi:hypothetical protein